MPETKKRTVSGWLSDLDSHEIYDEKMLKELEPMGITYDAKTMTLRRDDVTILVKIQTRAQLQQEIEQRGIGGTLNPGDWRGVSGFRLAAALCLLMTNTQPDDRFHGRGSKFRACLDAIRSMENI